MTWIKGRITIDHETVVDGEYMSDVRWNGWLCPRMTLDAAVTILDSLADEGNPDAPIYRVEGETLIVIEHEGYEDRYEPDDAGMYSLGAFAWVWSLADEAGDETCPVCGQADNCGDCDHTPLEEASYVDPDGITWRWRYFDFEEPALFAAGDEDEDCAWSVDASTPQTQVALEAAVADFWAEYMGPWK